MQNKQTNRNPTNAIVKVKQYHQSILKRGLIRYQILKGEIHTYEIKAYDSNTYKRRL